MLLSSNPVHDDYFADPFVFRHEDRYYAIGSGPNEPTEGGAVFPVLESDDFTLWRRRGRALVRPASSLGDTYWAPEVAFADGTFYLYYSVGRGDREHQLRVAASDDPGGPYRDCGVRLLTGDTCAFAIDPHPFRDDDGRHYLFYARDFLDFERGSAKAPRVRAGTALVVQELASMTELGHRREVVLRARHDWQRFQANRAIYGDVFDWHTLEGPCLQKRDGRYYCFYSGGRWDSDRYGVDVAVADQIWGPYSDEGAEGGPRVLRGLPGSVLGPGHNSIVIGPDGLPYMAYHAWDSGMKKRRMCIDPLVWTPDGPRCDGPTWRSIRERNAS